MATSQLSGRNSLQDAISNITAQIRNLYHLSIHSVSQSSLSRVNESQPYELYEALFAKLLARCQSMTPKHKFKNKLYSLDASTIDLCLKVFPWPTCRTMLRRAQQPPRALSDFMSGWITRVCGLPAAGRRSWPLPMAKPMTSLRRARYRYRLPAAGRKGSIVVMDRGYNDYA